MKINTARSVKGFTLIELMIAVAIVGMLAAIAYPSYLQYIQATWRESAGLCLLDMAQQMERRYAADQAYTLLDSDGDGTDDLFSSTCATDSGMDNRYQFRFQGAVVNGYRLQANPIGAQLADDCGALSVNQAGLKTVSGAMPVQDCW